MCLVIIIEFLRGSKIGILNKSVWCYRVNLSNLSVLSQTGWHFKAKITIKKIEIKAIFHSLK